MEERKTATAEMKYVRMSPRKLQIICDVIRGKDVKFARALLEHTPKIGREPLIKVLDSAVANAENNFEMDSDNLYIEKVFVNGGPILKRGRPRAHGRMSRINKRTSHITLVVAERD
ncbi:MAG: 50S ribosomal protein L22 [Clostridiales bacterium]|jgi:large subunit ribosomal protein L22|nr:50S ribosomal protein L22 [Clostridiales bacterium]